MKLRIPGNLLLFGEYAITLPGGKGVGIAVEPSVEIVSKPAERLHIVCRLHGGEVVWSDGSAPPSQIPLIFHILEGVKQHLAAQNSPTPSFPFHVTVDSSNFYDSDGRKKGLGSSAAVTVGLTYLLLHCARQKSPDPNEVFPLALSIHRSFQGGKGSGYDIAASLFGNAGLFTGGDQPSWEPISAPWKDSLFLLRGDKEVSSSSSVSLFNQFRESQKSLAEDFFVRSNTLANSFALCKNLHEANQAFTKGYELNRWIHAKLGIPSEGPNLGKELERRRLSGMPGKPLGAGGEIAAILADATWVQPDELPEPIILSEEGLRCIP